MENNKINMLDILRKKREDLSEIYFNDKKKLKFDLSKIKEKYNIKIKEKHNLI